MPEEWEAWVRGQGQPKYRGGQIFRWIHQRNVMDPAAMTDVPKRLRESLIEAMPPILTLDERHASGDGTTKLVVKYGDGARVETVLIPQLERRGAASKAVNLDDEADDAELEEEPVEDAPWSVQGRAVGDRVTQCISSQVGCAMGCVFCASGIAGLQRHLGPEEIVAQVLWARQQLPEGKRLTNVVFMGMGEPLHNYDAVIRAWRLLTHAEGIGLSTRRVTVSTSGLVPEIDRLGKDTEGRAALAISLHAVDQEKRASLMPIAKRYPLDKLMQCLRRYPLPPRRRITVEYTLVGGKNDSKEDASRLAKLLHGLSTKVNLIPMNPVGGSGLTAPSAQTVQAFQDELLRHRVPTFVRTQRGDDVAAACGQLVLKDVVPKVQLRQKLLKERP